MTPPPKQPPVTVGLRLPPSSKSDLTTVLDALKARGEQLRREDLVGALLHRAVRISKKRTDLDKLGADGRAQRARAKKQGF